jgi:FAD/FMN-containing dehydrogenase
MPSREGGGARRPRPAGGGRNHVGPRRTPVSEWLNWAGSLRFTPAALERPRDEGELAALVRRAAGEGRTARVVGAGHSSSPLVRTTDVLVSLERLGGLLAHDAAAGEATLGAGTRLYDVGRLLHEVGLGMENLGDVDTQTLGGVVGTGTHGSGKGLKNLSANVLGLRAVTAAGEIVEWSHERDAELVRAARVALGALGIFTAVRLRVVGAYRLVRREYCARTDECLERLDELAAGNRNFDFYWYPRRDDVKLRTLNPPGEAGACPPGAACLLEEVEEGWSHKTIARQRRLKFDEMEYQVPAEAGPPCFQELRRRVLERHRKHVGWRVLYRLVAADDAYLSPAFGRDTVAISVHQNASLPHEAYFRDVEPIFRAHGGRPHWAKKHSLSGEALRPLYPKWGAFLELRRRLDPRGLWLSDDLRALFGLGPSALGSGGGP